MPSGRPHYRVTLPDALAAHDRALSRYGGREGIPNLSLVESAIARPYSGYHRRIWSKAAALVESVARNHGFADGNKRTAVYLMFLLLDRSGYALSEESSADIEQVVVDVAKRNLTFDALEAWFKEHIEKA